MLSKTSISIGRAVFELFKQIEKDLQLYIIYSSKIKLDVNLKVSFLI